jgi:hypothetical protein
MKLPFFYNKPLINSFTFNKILNYQYYNKLLSIDLEIAAKPRLLDFIEYKPKKIFIKKKKLKNITEQLQLKYTVTESDFFFDVYDSIEYIDDDFLYNRLDNISLGFTFNSQDKYFINRKALDFDFSEKIFVFTKTKNFLNSMYNSLNCLSINNLTYKSIMPLKATKGGYFVLGFGLTGFMPINQIFYNDCLVSLSKQLARTNTNIIYLPFFESHFKISFFKSKKAFASKVLINKIIIYFLSSLSSIKVRENQQLERKN